MSPDERAARALQEAWDDGSDVASGLPPIEFTDAEAAHLARAVLQAVREPSEGMIEAGRWNDFTPHSVDSSETAAADADVALVWRNMIDKALTD